MGLFDFLFGKKDENAQNVQSSQARSGASGSRYVVSEGHGIEQCFDPLTFPIREVRVKKMGQVDLAPYDAFWYENVPDAKLLAMLANTQKLKRYLPGMDFSTEEKAKKALEGYMMRTEMGLGVTYVIRSQNMPIGMIFVNTPNYNKKTMGLYIWTIDFFILESMEHQGIMFNCLAQVLAIMKLQFRVPKVYAIVDKSNLDCINLLHNSRNPLFSEEDNSGFDDRSHPGESPRVFGLDLRAMNFQHR